MVHYTNLGDLEAETVALAAPVRGGMMHRFLTDEAIQLYCEQFYLENPIVLPDGQVTAYSPITQQRHAIGWGS